MAKFSYGSGFALIASVVLIIISVLFNLLFLSFCVNTKMRFCAQACERFTVVKVSAPYYSTCGQGPEYRHIYIYILPIFLFELHIKNNTNMQHM